MNKRYDDEQRPITSKHENSLFFPVIKLVDGQQKEIGVTAPDGRFFPFAEDERFIEIRNTGQNKRAPFIELSNGERVPFQEWRARQVVKNSEALSSAEPHFRELFREILIEFPELDQVEIINGDRKKFPVLEHTGGFWQRPDEIGSKPKIIVDRLSAATFKPLFATREISAFAAAEKIGIEYEQLKKNPVILGLFIFPHELGHVWDFISNYQNVKNQLEGYNPIEENRLDRQLEMESLPVRGVNPVTVKKKLDDGSLDEYYKKNATYYRDMKIQNAPDLLTAHENAYRKLPSEAYADDFAAHVVRKYLQKIGIIA